MALSVEESGDEEAVVTPSESEEEEEWSESSRCVLHRNIETAELTQFI